MPDVRTHRTRNEPRRADLDRKCDPRPPRPPLDAEGRELVNRHLPLAYKIVAPFRQVIPGLADDLESAAFLGLCEAAQTWDPDKRVTFGAYAPPRIAGAIKDLIEEEIRRGMIECPDVPDVRRLMEDLPSEPAGDEGGEPGEPPASFEAMILPLSEPQRAICRAVYVDGLSLRAASRALGIPKTSLRRELCHSIERLREAAASNPDGILDHPGDVMGVPDTGGHDVGRSTGDEGRDGNVGCGGPCEACGVPDPVCVRGGASGRARVDRPGRRCG